MATLHVPGVRWCLWSASVVGNVAVPGSYLHSVFILQLGSSDDDVWIADSGASWHMTHDEKILKKLRPPPPGLETVTIGDRRKLKVDCVGNLDVTFHRDTDKRIMLVDVTCVPGLGFNLYSLRRPENTLGSAGRFRNVYYRHKSDVHPHQYRTMFAYYPAPNRDSRRKNRQQDMHANNLLRQLQNPVYTPPQETPPPGTCARPVVCMIRMFS